MSQAIVIASAALVQDVDLVRRLAPFGRKPAYVSGKTAGVHGRDPSGWTWPASKSPT